MSDDPNRNEPTPPREHSTGEPNPSGPAGWPGATHFGAGVGPETPPRAPEPRVVEVEAEPISRAGTRGPSIDVGGAAARPAEPTQESGPTASSGSAGPKASPPPPPGAPTPPDANPGSTDHGRLGAVLAHLAYLIPAHIPGLIVTVVIWVWRRRVNPFLDDQAREALNFQLCYAVVNFALGLSCCCFAWLVFPVWLIGAVLSVVAAVEAGDGKRHRYPFIFRLIA